MLHARRVHASYGVFHHPQAEASGESKKDTQSSLAPIPSADSVKVEHKGRFEVYDSDASASSEARARCHLASAVLGLTPLTGGLRAPKCARGASLWTSPPTVIRCARRGNCALVLTARA